MMPLLNQGLSLDHSQVLNLVLSQDHSQVPNLVFNPAAVQELNQLNQVHNQARSQVLNPVHNRERSQAHKQVLSPAVTAVLMLLSAKNSKVKAVSIRAILATKNVNHVARFSVSSGRQDQAQKENPA